MALQIGDKAPNFSLYSIDKSVVSLEDFKGENVVLLFFPLAFSGGCIKEMCYMRDNYDAYNKVDAKVIAVSIDSIFTLGAFKEQYGLEFTMLSDFNKEASRAYDALYEVFVFDMKEVAKRSAFVIDGQGVIRYVEVLEDPAQMPDLDAIIGALEGLKGK